MACSKEDDEETIKELEETIFADKTELEAFRKFKTTFYSNSADRDEKLGALIHPSLIPEINAIRGAEGITFEILCVMAYFDSRGIQVEILIGLLDHDILSGSSEDTITGLLISAITPLLESGLIFANEYMLLGIKKSTQNNVRIMLKKLGMEEKTQIKALELLEHFVKEESLDVDSHVESVLSYVSSQNKKLIEKCKSINSLSSKNYEKIIAGTTGKKKIKGYEITAGYDKKLACEILEIIAYFESSNIHEEILVEICGGMVMRAGLPDSETTYSLTAAITSAIYILIKCRFIFENESIFRVNKLTQKNVRSVLQKQARQEATLIMALDLLESAVINSNPTARVHVECVLSHASRELNKGSELNEKYKNMKSLSFKNYEKERQMEEEESEANLMKMIDLSLKNELDFTPIDQEGQVSRAESDGVLVTRSKGISSEKATQLATMQIERMLSKSARSEDNWMATMWCFEKVTNLEEAANLKEPANLEETANLEEAANLEESASLEEATSSLEVQSG